ncbi:MAG: DUF4382 domain-containing protein [Candidatus Micrarchaeota archaeon]|nr:DUF4382 domain-containing protein [Candidatus Micrarchaeota archaeon]
MKNLGYLIGIIVVVIAAFLLFSLGGYAGPISGTTTIQNSTTTILATNSSISSQQQVPILMTDPPQVPSGTSAVVIAYSSIMLHLTGGPQSGWVSAKGDGTINLLSAVNSSTVIGSANLSANSSINLVRFNVSSATITVNGTTSNLTLQNSNVTVALTRDSRVTSNSSVLIDFFPTIILDSSANATTYSMAPSARAIVVANATVRTNAGVGARVNLSASMRSQLSASAPNLTIVSASIGSTNNITSVSVDVMNNANSSANISGVAIFGRTSGSVNVGAAAGISIGGAGIKNNIVAAAAASHVVSLGAISLSATSSGALLAAQSRADWQSAGYIVPPFSSVNLTYSGKITYQNGTVETNLISGGEYRLVVFGTQGVTTAITVTAK